MDLDLFIIKNNLILLGRIEVQTLLIFSMLSLHIIFKLSFIYLSNYIFKIYLHIFFKKSFNYFSYRISKISFNCLFVHYLFDCDYWCTYCITFLLLDWHFYFKKKELNTFFRATLRTNYINILIRNFSFVWVLSVPDFRGSQWDQNARAQAPQNLFESNSE